MNAKYLIPMAVVMVASQMPSVAQAPASTNVFPKSSVVLESRMDKISYCLGLDMAAMMRDHPGLKKELIIAGVRDVLDRKIPAVKPDEINTLLKEFEKEVRAMDEQEAKDMAKKNKEDGIKFLAENKSKEGVKVLPSGLQYKVIKDGNGPSAKPEDTVTVHYRGTWIDGHEFDSSYKRKGPSTVAMRYLIAGWKEALQLMKTGSKWQLFVPSELAYGERGGGREVPPNAALIYELELLEVTPPGK